MYRIFYLFYNGNTVQMTQVNHIRNLKDSYPTDDFVLVKQL